MPVRTVNNPNTVTRLHRLALVGELMALRVTSPTQVLRELERQHHIRVGIATVKRDMRDIRDEWRETRKEMAEAAFDADINTIDKIVLALLPTALGRPTTGAAVEPADQARAALRITQLFQRRAQMFGYDKQPLREIEAAAKAMAENPQTINVTTSYHPEDLRNLTDEELEVFTRVNELLAEHHAN